MAITTEELLTERIPTFMYDIRQAPDEAPAAFADILAQVYEVTGKPGSQTSSFDWRLAAEIADDNNIAAGDPNRQSRTRRSANRTSVEANGKLMRVHRRAGSFVVLDATGSTIATQNHPNYRVPGEYGLGDPYLFKKALGAATVEQLCHQGADWGEGYRVWEELAGEGATIGHATLHAEAYTPENAGTDRRALAYAGSTHRTLHPAFRRHIAKLPAFQARPQPTNPSDNLAGLLDSLSSSVAVREAMSVTYAHEVGGKVLYVVGMPDPTHPDNRGVNWD